MKLTVLLLIALLSQPAQSKPAGWYWWSSQISGKRVCSQTSPGEGWLRGRGPFNNSRCLPRSSR